MKASIQERVAPPTAPGAQAYSDAKIAEKPKARDSNARPEDNVNFDAVLYNSMQDKSKERKAKAAGDLSAGNRAEFLDKLADQTKQQRVPKNQLDKDDFLKLFVTQLQHQDPLNPDDGAELAAKLAQFNSVEQLMNVNKALENLAGAQSEDRSMQLASIIGKEVTVDGGRLRMQKGSMSESEYKVDQSATNAKVEVRDSSGTVVREIDLGAVPAGTHKLQWDGKKSDGSTVSDGTYTYEISAKDAQGMELPVAMTTRVKITGVDITDKAGGVFTDFGRVRMNEIKAVGEQGFSNKAQEQDGVLPEALSQVAAALPAGAPLSMAESKKGEVKEPKEQPAATAVPPSAAQGKPANPTGTAQSYQPLPASHSTLPSAPRSWDENFS